MYQILQRMDLKQIMLGIVASLVLNETFLLDQ